MPILDIKDARPLRRAVRGSTRGAIAGTALVAALTMPANAPSALSDRVSIELRGRILPRCAIAATDAAEQILTRSGHPRVNEIRRRFDVNCNAPFAVRISSAQGGLRHPSGQRFSYLAALAMQTDSGKTVTVSCDERDLGPEGDGCGTSSGDDTAIGKEAMLSVSWLTPEGAAPGAYQDDLRLSFSVQD